LPNHRAFVAALNQELKRSQRYYRPCALLFLDLDHFKALNDGYGHPAGDAVLQEFSTLVHTLLRGMDTVGRWGGEEFVALLPETDTEGALAAAERIRAAVAAHIFAPGGGVRLTCSVGIAAYPFDSEERDGLLRAADQAMYGAKKLGRNQVRTANDPAVIALTTEAGKAGSREEAALAGTVEALAILVEARDHYTGQHARQVATLTLQVALALGLDASEAYMIEMAGRLHDVGKVVVPDAVLQKPGHLTEEEWVLMRKHAEVGADVVNCVPSLRALAPVVRAHHERWDGQGYPDKLLGEAIPLGARIIAVVDAYYAMTTDRPYQPARDAASALAELRDCAGTQFDPTVVQGLERILATEQMLLEVAEVA
jgi:diguanylate cyclase (GGDEF)-like protein